MHNIRRTVAPVGAVLTLEELKAHTRIDVAEDDGYLAGLIEAATDYIDGYSGYLGRALIDQTWAADMSGFASFRLPLGPNATVTSLTYYDTDNVQQTFTGFEQRGDVVQLQHDQSWPETYQRADAATVTWTCGYGADWNAIPQNIRLGMMQIVAHWYANREAVGPSMSVIPMAALSLLGVNRSVPL